MDDYAQLLQKLQEEKKQLTETFLQLTPTEMMERALEFGVKEDMYVNLLVKYTEMNAKQRAFLLQDGSISNKLYQPWLDEGLGKEASFLEKPVVRRALEQKLSPSERLLMRAATEWQKLSEELLALSPKEILARVGEITLKEDTYFFLDYNLSNLSEKEIAALCKLEQPLEAVWQEYENGNYSLFDSLQQAVEHVAYEEQQRAMTQHFLKNPIQFTVLRLYRDEGTECMADRKLLSTMFLVARPDAAELEAVLRGIKQLPMEEIGFSINTYAAKEQARKASHPATAEELQFLRQSFASLQRDGHLQLLEAEYFRGTLPVLAKEHEEETEQEEEDEELELG